MITFKKNTRGFTLIELLVVITIIGILATGATTVYTSQIQKARDTTRINDVKALQSAVEQVYQDGGEYPHADTFLSGTITNKIWVQTYMPKLPRDPKDGQTCNNTGAPVATDKKACVYSYQAGADDNGIDYGKYVISAGFESLGKVQSDATKDGGTIGWRWETGNGIVGTSILNTDVPYTTAAETAIKTAGFKGIWDVGSSAVPANGTVIITIHGS